MIDLSKKYKTRNGCKVVGLVITLKNSAGGDVSYPVKGTVILGKTKKKYMIWSIDGVSDLVWGKNTGFDLVEDKGE